MNLPIVTVIASAAISTGNAVSLMKVDVWGTMWATAAASPVAVPCTWWPVTTPATAPLLTIVDDTSWMATPMRHLQNWSPSGFNADGYGQHDYSNDELQNHKCAKTITKQIIFLWMPKAEFEYQSISNCNGSLWFYSKLTRFFSRSHCNPFVSKNILWFLSC